jgi:membrane protein DedA with SNARE-associated domain
MIEDGYYLPSIFYRQKIMSKRINLLKNFLSSDLFLPALLLVIYLVFLIIAREVIPAGSELIADFQGLYQKYGYEIIFVAAFLEGLVLINLFVPGGGAVALGAIFARTGQTSLPMVILAGCLGAISAYALDFVLGYFGFSNFLKRWGFKGLDPQPAEKDEKFRERGLILSFIHPNVASFVSLAAGSTNYKIKNFIIIAVASTFFWGIIWASIVYIFGNVILFIFSKYSFLMVLLVILGFVLLRWRRK